MAGKPNPFPMGVSDPFPAGYVIWFGSLKFRATGNGYLMELLSPRSNPDVPTPQPRRWRRSGRRARQTRMERRSVACLGSPTWVEAGVPRADARVGHTTSSSSGTTATPTEGPAARPSRYPYRMRVLPRPMRRLSAPTLARMRTSSGIICSRSAASSRPHRTSHTSTPRTRNQPPRGPA